MDNTAIQQIQDTAAAVSAQELISTSADFPAVLVPEGFRLHSLEKYRVKKDRFSGNYKTFSQADFIAYCLDAAHKAQKVFVDGEAFKAVAFFDLGTAANPGHAAHSAALLLKQSAAYKAFIGFSDCHQSQQDTAEVLEDWADHFEAFDAAGTLVDKVQVITAVRNVTLESYSKATHRKENLSAERSLMKKVEANSEHQLPATLYFSCAPHLNAAVRRFLLRVAVTPRNGELLFKFRSANKDQIIEDMANDFAAEISQLLKGKCSVFIGSFAT